MSRQAKHVKYRDGSWVIQVNGHNRTAASFPTKYEAIKAAGIGKKGAPVVVHGKHGQIFRSFNLDSAQGMHIRNVIHEIVSGRKEGRKSAKARA